MCDVVSLPWYNEFLELNPVEARWRQLTIEYAEAQEPMVAEYFRRLRPRYWYEPDGLLPGSAAASLGFSEQEETQMLLGLARFVIPELEKSTTSFDGLGSSELRFPGDEQSNRADGVSGRKRAPRV